MASEISNRFAFFSLLDDYKKIREANSKGLSERTKMLGQTVVASLAILLLFEAFHLSTDFHVPMFRSWVINLKWLYFIFA